MAQDHSPFTVPPPAALNRPQRIRWRWIISIFAVPFLLVWLAITMVRVGYTLREQRGQKQMFVEIDKLADEGWPVDDESIEAVYLSRTSPDQVDLWLELLAQFDTPEYKQQSTGVPLIDPMIDDEFAFETVREPQWKYSEVCQRLVDQHSELISRAYHLTTDQPPVQFPIVFDSINTLLPDVQSLRHLGRLMYIDAHVAIHKGDGARGARDFLVIYSLGDHADAVPGAIPKLVGIALRQLAIEVLQRLLSSALLSNEQLLSIDERLKEYCQIGTRWRDTLSEERGMYLPVFQNPAAAMPSKKPMPPRGHDAVFYIEIMRKAMALDADKWPEFYDELIRLEGELRPDKGFSFRNLDRLLTHLVAPAYSALGSAFIRSVQANRLARLAIQVRMYQRTHMRWPTSLQDLDGEATNQLPPFGHKPFGYKLDGEQVTVWGFNMTDSCRETPDAPIEPNLNEPGSVYNARWIWKLQP